MRKFSRGTGGHFIETQVENEVGEGERVGREQEEELPHPAPPHPTLSSTKISPCGKQVMLGWVVWVWKHNVAWHKDITRTVMNAGQGHTHDDGGGSGADGLWLIDGSAVSLWEAATYTPEWVGIPLHHAFARGITKRSVLTQNAPTEMCDHVQHVQ